MAITLGIGIVSPAARAQHITIDGSLSPARTLIGPNYAIGANLGKQVGGNLFQSFGIFGLSSGESATFSGPATVANIIGRVTGGSSSSINGAIKSTIPGASLYLINPAGFVFGPSATVNVSGSFRAASADYLKTADGARFKATTPGGSTLSAAAPAAFGFLNATPGAIAVNGATLGVPAGQTLGLAGGTINVTGATLQAPAGTIHVTSVAGAGEVPVARNGRSTVMAHGTVSITQGSLLDVSDAVDGLGGGSIFVRAANLTVDGSELNADNYGAANGGRLLLSGDSSLSITDNAYVHSQALASGNGAPIFLNSPPSGTLTVDNSTVLTVSYGAGNGGSLNMIGGAISVTGSATTIETIANASGAGGAIAVSAQSMSVLNGAFIQSLAFGSAAGGNMTIAVAGPLLVQGNASNPTIAQFDSPFIGASTGSGSTAQAGNVSVNAATLTIDGGEIASGTSGAGNGGSVSVAVSDALTVLGQGGVAGFAIGIVSESTSGSTGSPGPMTVSAGTLSMTAGAQIGGTTFGSGNAGNINVDVAGLLSIDGSRATPGGAATGIFSGADQPGTGNAGAVNVAAGALSLTAGGNISTSTFAPGNAGSITLDIAGPVVINGSLAPPGVTTGVFSQANPHSAGDAGTIMIDAASLTVQNGGSISSKTFGLGNAGSVMVDVPGSMVIDDGEISSSTSGSGNAGSVLVSASSLTIDEGGEITTATAVSGRGGDINLTVGGNIFLSGGSNPAITAGTTAGGNAGSVVVTAGSLTILDGATISTDTTGGSGNGGNIALNIAGGVTIDGSQSTRPSTGIVSQANAGGTGNAGTIVLDAGSLTIDPDGRISSTTFGPGNAGSVTLEIGGAVTIVGPTNPAVTTGILSETNSASGGNGGTIVLNAGSLSILNNASISTGTVGSGNAGDIAVSVAGLLSLAGSVINPNLPAEISSNSITTTGAAGAAGVIAIHAGAITMTNGDIDSAFDSFGRSGAGAGNITVNVAGQLSMTANSGIGTDDFSPAGNGGNIAIAAGSLSLAQGGIATDTASSGNAGNVSIVSAGAISLDSGVIAARALAFPGIAGGTGNAGAITLHAGSLTLTDDSQISTSNSTSGPGTGGDINLAVGGSILLSGVDTAIAATSTASGHAGEITINAADMTLQDGAAISTQAATANGGNITLAIGDFLHLTHSSVTTSVLGSNGNGGNITIDPQLFVLDGSSIIAQAIAGHGGNITIDAGNFLPSDDSIVSASSALGISGSVDLVGPRVDLNGSLVVLSSELRSANDILHARCEAAGGNRLQSSLVAAGRGGLVQDPDAALPALYLAGRDLGPAPDTRSVGYSGVMALPEFKIACR